jgi:hypothetical protein
LERETDAERQEGQQKEREKEEKKHARTRNKPKGGKGGRVVAPATTKRAQQGAGPE